MDMYEAISSPSHRLNEQLAREIFEILPDAGPLVLIVDRDGSLWPSDSQVFADLQINESTLAELWSKIDDGLEPIISQINDCIVAASALATSGTTYGYVALFLPKQQPEAALANMDLIEIILDQVNLIARLIEKNALLYELQLRNICSQPATN